MAVEILVTKRMPLELFRSILKDPKFKIDMWHDPNIEMPREQFLQRLRGKSGLFLGFGPMPTYHVDKEALDTAGPQLKVVCTISVGYDHIDVDECKKRGIRVGYTPNVLNEAVAEFTVMLVLATIRRFTEATKCLRFGQWDNDPFWLAGTSIRDSVVGFIGAGRIGSSTMEKIKAFKPSKILYHCRNRNQNVEKLHQAEFRAELNELLSETDILIVICSLNESTKHLLSYEQFERMKPTSVVINTSRGAVIDQQALVQALKSGRIRAAGLDVMEQEPVPLDDPLMSMENVVLMPHIGSSEVNTRSRMIQMSVANLEAGLKDQQMPAEII